MPPCPVQFVLAETNKLAPASVRDGLGKMVISKHPGNVQILKGYVAESVNQLSTQLVMEVLALISYPFMLNGNHKLGLGSTIRAFLLAAQTALPNFQPPFRLPQVFGRFNLFTGGQGHKVLKPQVDSNFVWLLYGVLAFDLAQNRDKVFAAWGFGDGAIFHLALDGAMKDGANLADFGQFDAAADHLESLRIADRLSVVFVFEFGVFGSALEKVNIGPVKIFERLLQDLTIGFLEPRQEMLDCSQHVGCIVVTQALAVFFVVSLALSQGHIVDKAGVAELGSYDCLLLLVGVDSEFIRLLNYHAWFSLIPHQLIYQQSKLYSRQERLTVSVVCGMSCAKLLLYDKLCLYS